MQAMQAMFEGRHFQNAPFHDHHYDPYGRSSALQQSTTVVTTETQHPMVLWPTGDPNNWQAELKPKIAAWGAWLMVTAGQNTPRAKPLRLESHFEKRLLDFCDVYYKPSIVYDDTSSILSQDLAGCSLTIKTEEISCLWFS